MARRGGLSVNTLLLEWNLKFFLDTSGSVAAFSGRRLQVAYIPQEGYKVGHKKVDVSQVSTLLIIPITSAALHYFNCCLLPVTEFLLCQRALIVS